MIATVVHKFKKNMKALFIQRHKFMLSGSGHLRGYLVYLV